MTVLSVVQDACVEALGLDRPDSVYSGSGSRELVELQQVVQSAAEEISYEHDWQALKDLETITGDGTTEDFALPARYRRMVTDAKLWSTARSAPLRHVISTDEWLGLDIMGDTNAFGSWTMYDNEIHIKPAPSSGERVKYFYISARFVLSAAGAIKSSFSADDDTFVLNERLLKLSLIWKWKAYKGLAYAEDLNIYDRELQRLIARDGGARKIIVGRVRIPFDVETAFPYNVGV